MPDYKNSKLYTLRSHQTNLIYIGSTTTPLNCRLSGHKCFYKRFLNKKGSYITSCELMKYKDVYIELLINCPCSNKEELRKIEGQYIRDMECVNKNIAGRTHKEWYDENKDYFKIYNQDNKDKLIEYARQYRLNNKDKIKQYTLDNKDMIKNYNKNYYESNKLSRCQKINKKFNCVCGGKYTYINKSKHLKTKKHLKYINSV